MIATFAAASFLVAYGGGSAAPAATGMSLTEQGPKLSGAGEIGRGAFGFSVAVSGDGSTAIVGAPQDKNGTGAAWIFVRSGEGWVPQGGKSLAPARSDTAISASAWRCPTTATRHSSAAPKTGRVSGRRTCSHVRVKRGPRSRSSRVPKRSGTPTSAGASGCLRRADRVAGRIPRQRKRGGGLGVRPLGRKLGPAGS